MDKNSEEVNRIKEYVKNTHAATHKYYELEVEEVCIFYAIVFQFSFFIDCNDLLFVVFEVLMLVI